MAPEDGNVPVRQLGLAALGVERDAAACMTRRAAGLLTVEGDVRDFHPLDFDRVPGFIASPPCQTFSAAGKGAGRAALDTVYQLAKTMEGRQSVDFSVFSDERTGVIQLRWGTAIYRQVEPSLYPIDRRSLLLGLRIGPR
ncbi:DNA cytosine methyltransferase [Amycolatopsis australiensis]|uniref:DNA cytosine methyltransferase n=1 Tax=Amycolatopsis australiensis TaxID=546364 RepID=UPI00093128CE|nr:DNA cytosine methyltransferase [Amycolatopsis australiensis]